LRITGELRNKTLPLPSVDALYMINLQKENSTSFNALPRQTQDKTHVRKFQLLKRKETKKRRRFELSAAPPQAVPMFRELKHAMCNVPVIKTRNAQRSRN
jgi:hypothetical protein